MIEWPTSAISSSLRYRRRSASEVVHEPDRSAATSGSALPLGPSPPPTTQSSTPLGQRPCTARLPHLVHDRLRYRPRSSTGFRRRLLCAVYTIPGYSTGLR